MLDIVENYLLHSLFHRLMKMSSEKSENVMAALFSAVTGNFLFFFRDTILQLSTSALLLHLAIEANLRLIIVIVTCVCVTCSTVN